MRRRTLMMIPFLIMFIWGVVLMLWPCQQVQVTKVVETYTKKERHGTKLSKHYKMVPYAVVEVNYNGETAEVTVHDNMYIPIKPGSNVLVSKSITGRLAEYHSDSGYLYMGCGAFCAALIFVIDRIVGKQRAGS